MTRITIWCSLLILCGATEADIKNPETVIGIDLGATNSYIAACSNGKVETRTDEQGNRITPSIVAFIDNDILIGDAAKERTVNNPENTVFNVKKLLGKEWGDETFQNYVKNLPFKVIEKDNKPHVSIRGVEVFSPEEITAMIVKKMKDDVEVYFGEVTHAVVSVPTHFNDAQRKATKEACEIAGFKILRVVTNPIAAAIAYALDETEEEKNILVFDMGSATFEVSILNIDHGVIQILATRDTNFGGDNFDQNVLEYFMRLCKERGVDIELDDHAINKLKREIEIAKKTLSTDDFVKIETKSLFNGENFSEILTRVKFEELNMELIKSTLNLIEKALEDAEVRKEEIDDIILVGGSTKIPKIRNLVKELFGKEPSRSIEPDEVIAKGAAIFADKIIKEPEPPVYISMNPLSIGIETVGQIVTKLIPRNTIIPTKKKHTFSTANENQTTVTVRIYEGERLMAKDNQLLGKFNLIIPPGQSKPEIEVTLVIDANEVLVVTAEDKQTGVKDEIVLDNNKDRWRAEYIEAMILDAEKFSEDDAKARESVKYITALLEGHRDGEFEEYKKDLVNAEQGKREIDEL